MVEESKFKRARRGKNIFLFVLLLLLVVMLFFVATIKTKF
ncbi:putative membrane protein [Anaplasma phagocytophilum str. ApWI1]|uniref:Uncharacterized protein n=3 Tax=Anaplasma phagocytophilum TaxID=948 RepID=Q2GIA0_ANAPZ|nr:hypothetical protein APH_1410 [Anaplasma phagocytophilum str. HZ]AGR79782.1 hypothetical protein YYU_06540 [Anaplasma phagocytophilum str. HZ2]AGR81038.1 hypothetical protein WSQ_06580 [Anaplasma phagocytophilum str. JM]AGR82296.1 hypothetical protein YYY_06600 [Anaplasma phagocytophilum str. Dog2]KJV59532.1 putative membrane protein [Anaplasma phagocytophilum str. Webster]KJV68020.1 putative membrane protein [Anaplasma phagocytophilum str. ApNP]KJV82882.1 putative membrane protein [Anapla